MRAGALDANDIKPLCLQSIPVQNVLHPATIPMKKFNSFSSTSSACSTHMMYLPRLSSRGDRSFDPIITIHQHAAKLQTDACAQAHLQRAATASLLHVEIDACAKNIRKHC